MTKPKPKPIAFAVCSCRMLVMTSPENAGGLGECGGCLYDREHPMLGPEPPPHSPLEIRSRMVVGVLAVCLFGWLAFTVASSPGRPNAQPMVEVS